MLRPQTLVAAVCFRATTLWLSENIKVSNHNRPAARGGSEVDQYSMGRMPEDEWLVNLRKYLMARNFRNQVTNVAGIFECSLSTGHPRVLSCCPCPKHGSVPRRPVRGSLQQVALNGP